MSEEKGGDEMSVRSFQVGDWVVYKVGRGSGKGRILDFYHPEFVTIQTQNGKLVRRKVSALARG